MEEIVFEPMQQGAVWVVQVQEGKQVFTYEFSSEAQAWIAYRQYTIDNKYYPQGSD